MRISHQAILHGLPRNAGVLDSGTPNPARLEENQEHLSFNLLWELAKSGRPLDDIRRRHIAYCRDCREFVTEFAREACSSGLQVTNLLPKAE